MNISLLQDHDRILSLTSILFKKYKIFSWAKTLWKIQEKWLIKKTLHNTLHESQIQADKLSVTITKDKPLVIESDKQYTETIQITNNFFTSRNCLIFIYNDWIDSYSKN